MTETCDDSRRSLVRWSRSFVATSSWLRCRSCVDFAMYRRNEYQAIVSGSTKTSTPTSPSDWYASASAAPFTAVAR